MVDYKYRKHAGKAREILKRLENTQIKSKIYYVPYIFKTVNRLNLSRSSKVKKSDSVNCAQQIKGYINKLKYWKKNNLRKRTVDI